MTATAPQSFRLLSHATLKWLSLAFAFGTLYACGVSVNTPTDSVYAPVHSELSWQGDQVTGSQRVVLTYPDGTAVDITDQYQFNLAQKKRQLMADQAYACHPVRTPIS